MNEKAGVENNIEELKDLWNELSSFFIEGEKRGSWDEKDTKGWMQHLNLIA